VDDEGKAAVASPMREQLRTRLRLQRWRINHRYRQALLFALLFAGLLMLMEWAGFRNKFVGWRDPRPLNEIWWHLPIYVAFFFVGFILWPFHDRMDDGPRDC
jgi:hypothetical protein